MAAKYPSDDEVQLCPVDQSNPGSCVSPSCVNLHMCRDYLSTRKCSEFKSEGKCAYCHSLFTRHNQKVLDKKLHVSAKDEDTFERVSELIQKRKAHVDDQKSTMHNGGDSTRSLVTLRKTLSEHPNPTRFSMAPPLKTLTNSDYSPKSGRLSVHGSLDIMNSHRDSDDQRKSSARHSLGARDDNERSDKSSPTRSKNTLTSTVSGMISKVRGRFSSKSDPNDPIRTYPQLNYVFAEYDQDDELSYLHGPVRRRVVDRGYQIFASGYCRFASADEEDNLKTKLNIELPMRFKTDRVQFLKEDFGFFVCTSAAERVFEQISADGNKWSIISEPYSGSLSIEVIGAVKDDRRRCSSVPSRRILSPRLTNDREALRLPTPDGKFRISQTNSSIDVIQGDITEIPVDLMVCVTTSATLLGSILSKAGRAIESQFKRQSLSTKPIVLNGGSTAAQEILFIPWELKIDPSDARRALESLSKLVRRCMDVAYKLKSFFCLYKTSCMSQIGTGSLGLHPDKVCQCMIDTAIECLNRYKMDVLFVIYRFKSMGDPNEQSYRAFRSYLDELCRESKSPKGEASSASRSPRGAMIPIETSRQIRRDREFKHIKIVSDSNDAKVYDRPLLKSLERMIVERTVQLSSIQQQYRDQVELLIDLCLDYHVIPRIDYGADKLTLRGDRDSCSQCLFNLQEQRKIHKYSMYKKTSRSPEKIGLNTYVSMKIDEAFANGNEPSIAIEDDHDTIFYVDIDDYKIKVNDDGRDFELEREELNVDSRLVRPWTSSLMIRTIDASRSPADLKKYFRLFEKTMPKAEWHIERIDAIENWPLYVHYTSRKIRDEGYAFHGCAYSSVQSIIHYGLHSNLGRSSENSIQINHNALDSHIYNACRSTDRRYYMFIVRLEENLLNRGFAKLSNDTAHLALPTHLIVYRRETVVG